MSVNYQKRSNVDLFHTMAKPIRLNCSELQNYIPVYRRFFNLNESNFNSVNFNQPWFLMEMKKKLDPDLELYDCKLKNLETKKVKEDNVFFKLAPLVDPLRFLIGKYAFDDPVLFKLPSIHSTEVDTTARFIDSNNAAYVDSLFLYLSSTLLQHKNFIHKVDYFGSYLGIKNDYKFNVFDDLEYLVESSFFMTNKNKLFQVDDFDMPPMDSHAELCDNGKKPALKISSLSSRFSVESIRDDLFEDVFQKFEANDLHSDNVLQDLTNEDLVITPTSPKSSTSSSYSNSSCSSRTSYTEDEAVEEVEDSNGEDEDDDESFEEEFNDEVFATIPKCPVHIIAMEDCEETFDFLIRENENLPLSEWTSALIQIIMILITYQKVFSFTHNDLHTNNVMFKETNKKFIFYKFGGKTYKVPTYGRLFKIIDFGRSIFKYKDQVFCSDSFRSGGDAAGQYNIEPYFNSSKPRLEPNFSFDLCRLACSIFDYMFDYIDDVKDLSKCTPIQRLIAEWCLDDKGHNMLYKNNGLDRYPDFKLYKMIARSVHNHTPQAQLQRPEFSKYVYTYKKGEKAPNDIIDIDSMAPQFT